jgi:hypothetical protein
MSGMWVKLIRIGALSRASWAALPEDDRALIR